MTKKNKKNLAIGGGLLLLLIIVFVFGKKIGNKENEDRQIDVSVNIEDNNGTVTTYDPNPLLVRLNKGLTTRYFFDFSERCEPTEELYNLDSLRFVAVVKAYKEKYGVDIKNHMKACHVDCNNGREVGTFTLIYNRIDSLKDIIK